MTITLFVVREGLEVVLASEANMEMVGQANNGDEAVRLAQETTPDVIILDLQMPVKDVPSGIRDSNQAGPDAQILVLTSFPDNDKVFAAIQAGTIGFLLKDSLPQDLLSAIRAVSRGESVLHPTIAIKLIAEMKNPSPLPLSAEPLVLQELDVLRCLARGFTNREIAHELSISVRSVTSHVRSILGELHLANRSQAALYAVEQGLVSN